MTIELGNKGIPLGSYEEGSGGATVDCYSKEETDNLLDGKQNKLNISAPIQISKLSSVPDNISVSSDGTTMYLNYSAYTVPYPSTDTFRYMGGSNNNIFSFSKGTYESGKFVFKDGKHGKAMQINLSGYFHYLHNFKIGDVIKFTYDIPCVIGHLDSDNYFEPYIVLYYSSEVSSWARIYTNISGYSVSNSSFTFNSSVNIGQKYGYQSYAFSNQSIRFVEDDNGKIKIQACAYKTHANGNGFYAWDDITLDDTYDAAGLNCILFGNEPWSSAQEPPVSSLSSKNKIYPDTQSIFYAATFADAENPTPIVVPGDIAEIETLNLAIDSTTLSVVDNKLTAVGGARIDDQNISESTTWSSDKINTKMVTKDTDQVISAQKRFSLNSRETYLEMGGNGNYGIVFRSNNSPRSWYISNAGYTASTLSMAGFGSITLSTSYPGADLLLSNRLKIRDNSSSSNPYYTVLNTGNIIAAEGITLTPNEANGTLTIASTSGDVESLITSLQSQISALEERVATLESQPGGGAAPAVTFSYSGGTVKAGAATSSNTLQSDSIGSITFGTSGSAEIK